MQRLSPLLNATLGEFAIRRRLSSHSQLLTRCLGFQLPELGDGRHFRIFSYAAGGSPFLATAGLVQKVRAFWCALLLLADLHDNKVCHGDFSLRCVRVDGAKVSVSFGSHRVSTLLGVSMRANESTAPEHVSDGFVTGSSFGGDVYSFAKALSEDVLSEFGRSVRARCILGDRALRPRALDLEAVLAFSGWSVPGSDLQTIFRSLPTELQKMSVFSGPVGEFLCEAVWSGNKEQSCLLLAIAAGFRELWIGELLQMVSPEAAQLFSNIIALCSVLSRTRSVSTLDASVSSAGAALEQIVGMVAGLPPVFLVGLEGFLRGHFSSSKQRRVERDACSIALLLRLRQGAFSDDGLREVFERVVSPLLREYVTRSVSRLVGSVGVDAGSLLFDVVAFCDEVDEVFSFAAEMAANIKRKVLCLADFEIFQAVRDHAKRGDVGPEAVRLLRQAGLPCTACAFFVVLNAESIAGDVAKYRREFSELSFAAVEPILARIVGFERVAELKSVCPDWSDPPCPDVSLGSDWVAWLASEPSKRIS